MRVMFRRRFGSAADLCLALGLMIMMTMEACARLPYTTQVIHEDPRLVVKLQHEINRAGYTHPVELTSHELRTILEGFSLREQKSLPLRWFAEEVPPVPVFREDELDPLTPQLAEALRKAGPEERVYFELYAPGINPEGTREVTAGWVAVRESLLYLSMLYFHAQYPTRVHDPYFPYYTKTPPSPTSYLLYFEPARYWILDEQSGRRGVGFRSFLKSGEASGGK